MTRSQQDWSFLLIRLGIQQFVSLLIECPDNQGFTAVLAAMITILPHSSQSAITGRHLSPVAGAELTLLLLLFYTLT